MLYSDQPFCPYHPLAMLFPEEGHVPDKHGQWWLVKKVVCSKCDHEIVVEESRLMTEEEILAAGLRWPLPVLAPLDVDGETEGTAG